MADISYPSSWDFGADPEFQELAEVRDRSIQPVPEWFLPSEDELDFTALGFGKYRDKTPAELLKLDAAYLYWAMTNVTNRPKFVSDKTAARLQKMSDAGKFLRSLKR